MKFATLEGQRVAVWGCGREGRATLAALHKRLPNQSLTLFCNTHEAASLIGQTGIDVRTNVPDVDTLSAFDIVIKSPGISIYKPEIVAAQKQGTVFTSGTALWFGENPDARVIGITGTKGKSTTAAMTAHLARAVGVRTALAGNIGLPLLELDGQSADLWIIELSSFQTGEAGPLEVGVITSLYEEHLDWHGSRERYVTDKLKLVDVSRTLIVNATQSNLLERTARHPQRVMFGHPDGWHVEDIMSSGESQPRHSGVRRHDGNEASTQAMILRGNAPMLPLSALPISGHHNALNACAALTALERMGMDADAAVPALKNFQPLPHRLQHLGRHDDLDWINDSISTTPEATLVALDSLGDAETTVILGGHDRGLDWSHFAQSVQTRPHLRLIVQGANGPRIAAALGEAGVSPQAEVGHLDEAVTAARHATPSGGVVLLSPGAPSFDQFHDYTARGRHFADLAGFDGTVLGSISGLGIA